MDKSLLLSRLTVSRETFSFIPVPPSQREVSDTFSLYLLQNYKSLEIVLSYITCVIVIITI
nr:MAG TPA: hypothetical protein [Caudoviricetes sp.]